VETTKGNRLGKLQIIRYVVVLVTGFIAGSRCVDAVRSWREWRTVAATDLSAANPYRDFFLMSALAAAISLVIAALVWWLLRPQPQR
jgi:H+/gluconate symporter-like permease